jgi:hypothetical protein
MDATIINKNSLFKKLLARHGASSFTYKTVSESIEGCKSVVTKEQAKQLLDAVEEVSKVLKANIKNSIL